MEKRIKNVCVCLDPKTIDILKRTVERQLASGNLSITKSALIRYAVMVQENVGWAGLPKSY